MSNTFFCLLEQSPIGLRYSYSLAGKINWVEDTCSIGYLFNSFVQSFMLNCICLADRPPGRLPTKCATILHTVASRVPAGPRSLQVGVGSWQLNFVSFPSNFRALSSQKLLLLLLYKIKAAERGPSLSSQQFAIVIRQSCPRSELSKSRPLPH